jgi:hydroxymethylbilane synthase
VTDAQIIRIATRSSELALRQARTVAGLLEAAGVRSELVTYKTTGDKNLAQPLSEIGAKGLFTKELEDDLARGKVDCCVHSLKDLPTAMPAGLELGALLPREDPRDVLIVNHNIGASSIAELPRGSRVGTSSLRRRAQLMALRTDLDVVELRGNVPTRIKKVDDEIVHAAILAAAGLHRLDVHQRISAYLDAPAWLPAAGQGAIAVQIRSDDVRARMIIGALNDSATEIATRAERGFLAALEGGCQVPIGALAVNGELHGFISSVDGRASLRDRINLDVAAPESCGQALAERLRGKGAEKILANLGRIKNAPAPQPE